MNTQTLSYNKSKELTEKNNKKMNNSKMKSGAGCINLF